ncbi:YiiD C-terminal domain-containing protein [Vulcaniibacterium gelatinicum]|uniref:YiiD C-terminal domain-containing protein n=1 Tax=Vulcaniibacterium gelatinicum TaxID=2598725 RepID=UPI0011CAC14A|nr:YiiD C-terminal domain-containing protein [Vulcaniibacterium gelatinicum]
MTDQSLLRALDAHYRSMPPVAALGLSIAGYDGRHLRLRAPLAANVNDKGCAFGGSLASLMTLAAWGLVSLRLGEAGLAAEVYVADSQLRYLKPLYADLEAEAELAPDEDWDVFLATFRSRGRARAQLLARVRLPDGAAACTFEGRYVAIAKG